ncbi:hypothetical protein ACE6H2_026085 [Prunus campanulata]
MRIIHVDDKNSSATGSSHLVECTHVPSRARSKPLESPPDKMGLLLLAIGYYAHAHPLVETWRSSWAEDVDKLRPPII